MKSTGEQKTVQCSKACPTADEDTVFCASSKSASCQCSQFHRHAIAFGRYSYNALRTCQHAVSGCRTASGMFSCKAAAIHVDPDHVYSKAGLQRCSQFYHQAGAVPAGAGDHTWGNRLSDIVKSSPALEVMRSLQYCKSCCNWLAASLSFILDKDRASCIARA